jgi:hypothetical protein
MVQIDDVKHLSHEVVASHNRRGFALVKLTPTDNDSVGVLLNVTKEPLVVEGKELKAKADVRRFLWEHRNSAKVRRKDRTWIWTRYLEDKGVSVMGFAAMTKREVAEKLAALNPDYQWIEVGT